MKIKSNETGFRVQGSGDKATYPTQDKDWGTAVTAHVGLSCPEP